jgi:hypothetical protein
LGRGDGIQVFEIIIPDEFVIDGQSVNGGNYREHVVPCAAIRSGCKAMYEQGASIADVVSAIDKYLRIALITPEEASCLDKELGLKTSMPEGWVFGEGDPLERLYAAGIKLA